MSSLVADKLGARATAVHLTADTLHLDLADGRSIAVPLAWYPRLMEGTAEERASYRLIGAGDGIHWADLDEDISVENILSGERSGESQKSFQKWLEARHARKSK